MRIIGYSLFNFTVIWMAFFGRTWNGVLEKEAVRLVFGGIVKRRIEFYYYALRFFFRYYVGLVEFF